MAARWLMLHARGRHPKLAPAVASAAPPPAAIVSLVMDTSLLEFEVKRSTYFTLVAFCCISCILFWYPLARFSCISLYCKLF